MTAHRTIQTSFNSTWGWCLAFYALATASGPVVAQTPLQVVKPVDVQCRWSEGFWQSRLNACRHGSMTTMARIIQGTDHSQFMENFRIAAGKVQGRHRGPAWNDGDCYKWIEAVASLYANEPTKELGLLLDESIAEIATAQREDGYLHTPVQIRARSGDETAVPFADALQFELYNMGHLLTAACVHHRATGKDTLLKVAKRAADFLVRTFGSQNPPLQRSAICPAHYMGLIELSRETGNPEYLELAKFLIQHRDQVVDGTDDNQDRLPLREHRQVVGHAVRANYLYAGVAELMLEEPNPELIGVLKQLWKDVEDRKIYITGGCGALFDGASPDGSSNQKVISRTHQAFGRPYQLPNSTAHNESCAAIGNVLWSQRMFQLTGDSAYVDAVERTLYNAVLASISLDGTRYFYTNTLRQLDKMPVDLRWSRDRQEFIKCFCCPPNIVRTIANVSSLAYHCSARELRVNLYGSNNFDAELPNDQRLKLTQKSQYPWEGEVEFTVQSAPTESYRISLRIPKWADAAEVLVNGQATSNKAKPGYYCSLDRQWKTGDRIELRLPMRVKRMIADPLVEETRNQVAIQRGPIVYCLESVDLPEGRRLQDAFVPLEQAWHARYEPKLLDGISVLEGKLAFEKSTVDTSVANQTLYREIDDGSLEYHTCRLIPYYAWGNRGKCEMSVWMPLIRGTN